MTTRQMGAEGFRWFVGVVEDRNDPLMLGRVRVRAHQMHDDPGNVPTSHLPWAFIVLPPTNASLGEVGVSPTGLVEGSTVFGFFADGNEGQVPIIIGSMPGIPDAHDVTRLARQIQSLPKTRLGPEPESAYGAKYPFNKAYQSESGHAFEVDDTPGQERLHLYHKSGTYVEINAEGRKVVKVVGDDYEIVAGRKEVFVKGDVKIVVQGNADMTVNGNVSCQTKGNHSYNVDGNLSVSVKGNYQMKAASVKMSADSSYNVNAKTIASVATGPHTVIGKPLNIN